MKIIRKTWHGFVFIFFILIYFLLYPIGIIIFSKRNIWLISEIDFDARDNGYCFFRYLIKNHPEINCKYLISSSAKRYDDIKKTGKAVAPNSLIHMLLYAGSRYIISTVVGGADPELISRVSIKHKITKARKINLKHGIYKDFSRMDLKNNAHQNLICCGAYPEYIYILSTYGYSSNEVAYTGLARFDNLHNYEQKRTILIMPTWRKWLDGSIESDAFLKSNYFLRWDEVLKSSLIKQCIAKGYRIVFFIHPKLNRFTDKLNDILKGVEFCNSKNSDLQDLIGESEFLITDYSSVFFDFAYLNKAVFYYQFDEERFYELHYTKTYFDYRRDGFGPVCCNLDNLSIEVTNYFSDRSLFIDKYSKNRKRFFTISDNKNCERIYNAISGVL